MFKAILRKEFIKIKKIYLALIILLSFSIIYLYLNILQNFSAIEPHSMLWYQAVFIGDIYYDIFKFLPSIFAVIIALSQFLPELSNNKFRIVLHLPLNQNKMLFLYLSVGFLLLSILNISILLAIYFVSKSFYPHLISISATINAIPWILASYILYNAMVAIMLEPFWKRKAFLCVLFFILISMLFLNKEYEAYNNVMLIYILITLISFFIPALSLFRFKNGNISFLEMQNKISTLVMSILIILSFCTLSFYLPHFYKEFTKNDALQTYVFYSNLEKKFVYKKHFGKHHFTYGDSLGNKLSQNEFEDALPFVYWRNLQMQKKLPIIIDNKIYTKTIIKQARQSFKFDYKDISNNKKQIKLYPLFNPDSSKGQIIFPDIMFNLDNRFTIYDSHDNDVNKELTIEYTNIFKKNNFLFPAKIIAGKTSNIKPLDEGYFILDQKNDLFHMKLYDNIMNLEKISYDKSINIQDIKISESRKKEFYGTLLDQDGNLYIISYKNYELIKLKLPNYDAYTMKLQIYANPINKLIRYQNKNLLHNILFDKDFNYIKSFTIDIPQNKKIYKDIYEYIFPFVIEKDIYKSYVTYNIKFNSYKAYILSLLFALTYLIFTRKQKPSILLKAFLLLIGGIYTLCFITFI